MAFFLSPGGLSINEPCSQTFAHSIRGLGFAIYQLQVRYRIAAFVDNQ
jgi:hypothetical protein